MFKPERHGGRLLGYSLEHEHVFFFFGARDLKREDLMAVFPEYEYAFLKQLHGKAVVPADPLQEAEADAHFTRRATRAPVVQTADCVPVLLASKNQVCAIHAGWRGAAQNIIAAAKPSFEGEPVLFAAIGPHILGPSFEIGKDVEAQLLAAAPAKGAHYVLPHPSTEKSYFDLTQLIRDQITAAYGPKIKIFECLHDTLTDTELHSFRRQGAQAGRQYSFVVLNS